MRRRRRRLPRFSTCTTKSCTVACCACGRIGRTATWWVRWAVVVVGGRLPPPPPRQRQRSRSRSPRPPRGVRAPASESAIYVGNLAYTTSADTLRMHAENVAGGAAGAPASVDVPTHADSGRARGYALLSYPTPEAAEAAVAALNESECDGRRLLVRRDQGGFVGA